MGGGVWSQGGVDYIVGPFPEHNYGIVIGVLEALLCLGIIIWSSHADLSGSGLHKLIAVFNTLTTPCWRQCHTAR